MSRRAFIPTLSLLASLGVTATSGARAAPPGPAAPSEEERAAQAIERALQRHGPEVHRCFEQALADRLDTAGELEVEIDVGAGGRVTGARLTGRAEDAPPSLATCVRTSARTWSIEGIEAGASVILPFAFAGQTNQYVVKSADVPLRGPAAAPGGKDRAPFGVKILIDPTNVRHAQASLTQLTVGPASRVAMQRHPRSAKILYLLAGRARVLGPDKVSPLAMDEGTAVFLPPGYPHAIENLARQADAVFLQIFSPPGPERVYRDPRSPEARADFEVLRAPRIPAPAGPAPVAIRREAVSAAPAFEGQGQAVVLLDEKSTGSPAFGLALLQLAPRAKLPRHQHAGSGEIIYVLSGGGTLTIGSEVMSFGPEAALHIPADQPHALEIGATATTAVQIFAPAGPEQAARPGN